jgi:hypothetical protein
VPRANHDVGIGLTAEAGGPTPRLNADIGIGLTPEAGGLTPRLNADIGIGLTPEAGGPTPRLNADIGIGLTAEAGGPSPRLNHALTCVVTRGYARRRHEKEKGDIYKFRTGLSAVCLLIAESTRAPGAGPSRGSMAQCQKAARALPRVAIVASRRRTAAR